MKKKVAVTLGAVAIVAGSVVLKSPVGLAATTSDGSPLTAAQSVNLARSTVASLVATDPARFHATANEAYVDLGVVSQDGLQYVGYSRQYAGLPVFGGDFVVVTDSAGAYLSSTVAQERALLLESTTATVGVAEATRIARGKMKSVVAAQTPQLTVVAQGAGVLAYEVVVEGTVAAENGGQRPSRQHVFVNAATGAVMKQSYDEVLDAAGTGAYYGKVELSLQESGGRVSMIDTARPGLQCGGQDGTPFAKAGGEFGTGAGTDLESACVDAMHAVAKEWDMLKEWLGRDGIDGKGRGFPIQVGLQQVNAFWNGRFTSYGHSQDNKRQLTVMDVVGHEFGHAIFQNTPGGSGGGNESGGLNESTGDIFGALTESFANDPKDKPDYDVGELADLVGQGPIRVMSDPSKVGDPNCFSNEIPNTEVHAAAGPQNHWFYLLAEGSNPASGPASPTCDNSKIETGIGIQKAGKIFMGALNRKTSGWTHAKARAASVAAAAELFPNGPECQAVKTAWTAVSVPASGNEPGCASGPGGPPAPTASPTDAPTPSPQHPSGGPTETASPGVPPSSPAGGTPSTSGYPARRH
ncbi:M4 family metallopeptidase [Pilimelia columellifera]|uniref:Neutral metalloproteinase n=1 Tax=Pilimelia columellifera subsp. columellifera TaxID=706583 RepID=A0ABP6AUW2_9ACTN